MGQFCSGGYTRFSTEMQSARSIDDQVRICQARAEREGWTVTEIYADYAISGANENRPRFQQLSTDARAGRFDVVLAEALDRLSRDQEHLARLHKQLRFSGVRIVTLAEGEVGTMHVGLGGTMGALFLEGLRQKTHRGLEGRVRAGKSGGGLSFGYSVSRGFAADGRPLTGDLVVIPEQVEVIRRIFNAYAEGQSPRSIAKQLNAERVPGPRGGRWTASLLLGNAQRENGMLRNRLYAGERVWNRQRFDKDPDTGKRVSRPNPKSEWVIIAVPELAVIDHRLWETVQTRLEAARQAVIESHPGSLANKASRLASQRRPRWPLAGLVRCGLCDGPMSVAGTGGRLACANHVERGTCDNKRTILKDVVLDRVLRGLKERLLAPELVEEFVRSYVAGVNTANRERGARQAALQAQQAKLDRQIRNLLELIKDGHGSAAMAADIRDLEAQRDRLQAELAIAAVPEPMPVLHDRLPEFYRWHVEVLEEALQDERTALLAAAALRHLVDAVVVHPGENRGQVKLSLRGDLAAFLDLGEQKKPRGSGAFRHRNGCSGEVWETLVAGIGFEPMTFRL